jgi:hypothetical protein
MKFHEGVSAARSWEPGFAGLHDRREATNERTIRRLGVFVRGFSPIVSAAKGGAQLRAFMFFMV